MFLERDRVSPATKAAAVPKSFGRQRLHFAVGIMVFLSAVALFIAIAINVSTEGGLEVLDLAVARSLHEFAIPSLTAFMMAVTTLNSTFAVACYAGVIAMYQGWHRRWLRVATLLVCVGGGLLLNDAMKHVFRRARPVLDHPLLNLETYSFPSGHAAGSTLLYGVLLVWLWRRTGQWRWRTLGAATAVSMVVLVSFSRLYLGVHFLSDVVAGVAEALAWLALCLSTIDVLRTAPSPAVSLDKRTRQ